MRTAPPVLAASVLVGCALALTGCKTPTPKPSLLDREFEAYRLDRDERRTDDLKSRGAKAKVEAERLENELASLMRRIREAKAKLPDARAEVESLPAVPPPPPVASAPTPAAIPVPSASASPAIRSGPLPPPEHRTPPTAPR